MVYMGSKRRMALHIAPIIQSYITPSTAGYLEPFVGGANMIDKIQCHKKIGTDSHKPLIELLKYVQCLDNDFPDNISEAEYILVKNNRDKYPEWYVGLVGFCASFSGKYFGGYARDRQTNRNIVNERLRNLETQRKDLVGIHFGCRPYQELPPLKNYVIYCDPPYSATTKYSNKDRFDTVTFWEWVRVYSKDNTVLVSEYSAPDDFKCLFSREQTTPLALGAVYKKPVEGLYIKR